MYMASAFVFIVLYRLHANDRVDPYVALYDAPESSTIGTLSHVRWRGGVLPHDLTRAALESFTESVLDCQPLR